MMLYNFLNRALVYNDPYYYAFVISTVVLIIVLLLLFLYFVFTGFRKSSEEKDRDTLLEQEAYEEALKVLDDARATSLKIITSSQTKALKSIDDVSRLNQETKKELQLKLKHLYTRQLETLEALGSDLLSSYKSSVEKEKEESLASLEAATDSLKKDLSEEVASFKDLLKKETFETQKEIDAKVRQGYVEVEEELRKYKDQKVREIDSKVILVISEVSAKYLGKTLNMAEHESLVISLLEEELSRAGL